MIHFSFNKVPLTLVHLHKSFIMSQNSREIFTGNIIMTTYYIVSIQGAPKTITKELWSQHVDLLISLK